MEDLIKFLESRHSVRTYTEQRIEDDKRQEIINFVNEVNQKHGTRFEVFFDKPEAYKSIIARHTIKGCSSIIVFYHYDPVDAGYFSAKVMLKLHEMGLSSCYVGASYKKRMFEKEGLIIQCALAFGYATDKGQPHKNKDIKKLMEISGNKPDNFDFILRAAMSAPTAMNLQRFKLVSKDGDIDVKLTSNTPFAEFDYGIIRYYVHLAKKN